LKILITGAGGFLGRATVRAAAEHDVVASMRTTHPAGWLAKTGAKRHAVELGYGPQSGPRNTKLQGALHDVDAVIHCAGRVRWGTRAEFERDNPRATEEVLDAARRAGVKRFVHVSSTAVYGNRAPERGPVTEDCELGYRVSRLDRYTRSKIAAEERVLAAMQGDMEVVSVRPGWIIGPGSKTLTALGQSLGGPVFPMMGRGDNRVSVTSSASVASALLLAATVPGIGGQAFNVAQDETITQKELLEAVAEAAGVRARLVPVPYDALYAGALTAELLARAVPGKEPPLQRSAVLLLGQDAEFPSTKIRAGLGWEPAAPIRTVIREAFGSPVR